MLLKSDLNHENKLASEAGLLNESSFSAPALGITQLPSVKDMILAVLLKFDLNADNKPASETGLLNQISFLAQALRVTQIPNAKDMILVKLSCAT